MLPRRQALQGAAVSRGANTGFCGLPGLVQSMKVAIFFVHNGKVKDAWSCACVSWYDATYVIRFPFFSQAMDAEHAKVWWFYLKDMDWEFKSYPEMSEVLWWFIMAVATVCTGSSIL